MPSSATIRPFCGRALQLSNVSKLVSGHAVFGACVAFAPRRVATDVEPPFADAPAAAAALRFRVGWVVPEAGFATTEVVALSLMPFAGIATLESSVGAVVRDLRELAFALVTSPLAVAADCREGLLPSASLESL